MTTRVKPGRWVRIEAADVQPGDLATYCVGDKVLDPRPVVEVVQEAGAITLDIMGTESGPYPIENYTFQRLIEAVD